MSSPRSISSTTRWPGRCNCRPATCRRTSASRRTASLLRRRHARATALVVIDGDKFGEIGFIQTGVGAHGLYPSRDGTKLYVSNRGTHNLGGLRNGEGSVSVIDFATRKVVANWTIPGGGSPDMGNVSADGKWLWLSGRYDGVGLRLQHRRRSVKTIPVGGMPHGLTVWPQPGRYSLGHTGNMR